MRVALVLVLCLLSACTTEEPSAPITFPSPSPSVSPSASPSPSPKPAPSGEVLLQGNGTFTTTASGGTGVAGTAGALRRYCVQVEDGITTFTPEEFAVVVDQVLADDRSWIASKRWMFQRIETCDGANLRVRLTTPKTTDKLCASAGVNTISQYSCRNGNAVFINLRRWTNGVAHYPPNSLDAYRHMVINHEVGHYLGFGHIQCRGAGQVAAVMQQQSISLKGCVANSYPYPDGVNYVG